MEYARPLTALPLVLCGPQLRRVERRQINTSEEQCSVSVFIALKYPRKVTLSIYDGGGEWLSGSRTTIALGSNLHVVVVTAATNDPNRLLDWGTRYEYQLRLEREGNATQEDNDDPISLFPEDLAALPSFLMPPTDLTELRVAHGSCRKPHGGGRDMLAFLDQLLGDPARRPHQLILTGDQIYADDVEPALLRALNATAQTLLGWSEQFHIAAKSATLSDDWEDSPLQPPQRAGILKQHARFTSGEKDAHLMFLGEFYAMYLLAWSEVLWTLDLKEDPKLQAYATALPAVRRVLANTPTLMIFDDHEITDDWNLDGEWANRVRNSTLGPRMLRNGLLAYAIFQDWGNQPQHYENESSTGGQILAALSMNATTPPAVHSQPQMLDKILDIGPATSPADQRKRWDYVVRAAAHQLVVLDTRTWRSFPDPTASAGLIDTTQLTSQLGQHRLDSSDITTLVVSPAPVIGIPLIEEGVQSLAVEIVGWLPSCLNLRPGRSVDHEAWLGNRQAFEALLRELARFKQVVLLSGDVHYAFTNEVAYFRDDDASAQPARIVQLCASSLHNEDCKTQLLGLMDYRNPGASYRAGWVGRATPIPAAQQEVLQEQLNSVAWHLGSNQPNPDDLPSAASQTLGQYLYFKLLLEERFDAPAVLPTDGWRSDQAVALVGEIAQQAQWRYTIRFVGDQRDTATREQDVFPIAADHSIGLVDSKALIGSNNIGLIDFVETTEGMTIRHRLGWHALNWLLQPRPDLVRFTEQQLRFTQPGDDERPEVRP